MLGDPGSSKVELSVQVLGHGIAQEACGFDYEVLQDRAEVVKLVDGSRRGRTLVVDEGLAERLVAVERCLVGGETFADSGNMPSFFQRSGDEARLDLSVRIMVIARACGRFSEGTKPAAKVG